MVVIMKVKELAGWRPREIGEESPDFIERGVPIYRERATDGKCHRNVPPRLAGVRVKSRGKSSRLGRVTGREGKPRRKQGQIGTG